MKKKNFVNDFSYVNCLWSSLRPCNRGEAKTVYAWVRDNKIKKTKENKIKGLLSVFKYAIFRWWVLAKKPTVILLRHHLPIVSLVPVTIQPNCFPIVINSVIKWAYIFYGFIQNDNFLSHFYKWFYDIFILKPYSLRFVLV